MNEQKFNTIPSIFEPVKPIHEGVQSEFDGRLGHYLLSCRELGLSYRQTKILADSVLYLFLI